MPDDPPGNDRSSLLRLLGVAGVAGLAMNFIYIYAASAICVYFAIRHDASGRPIAPLVLKACQDNASQRERTSEEVLAAMLALVSGALIATDKKP